MQIQDIQEGNTLTHKEETEIQKIIIKKTPKERFNFSSQKG